MIPNIGAILEAQFALVRPLSRTGMKLKNQYIRMKGKYYLSVQAARSLYA